jgi:pimeloyl-ACP methyl ester carboxylesterase
VFEGFTLEYVEVGEVTLRVRHGGQGQPVVLLHGHPRTHATWHRVAPRLADSLFVVCPDLRGYGQSTLPPDAPEHAQSSKRAMAHDVVSLMRHFGHDRFAVVGHDRGSLVAFRTAMDHPDAVTRLVVMDGLPVVEHLDQPARATRPRPRVPAPSTRTGWGSRRRPHTEMGYLCHLSGCLRSPTAVRPGRRDPPKACHPAPGRCVVARRSGPVLVWLASPLRSRQSSTADTDQRAGMPHGLLAPRTLGYPIIRCKRPPTRTCLSMSRVMRARRVPYGQRLLGWTGARG